MQHTKAAALLAVAALVSAGLACCGENKGTAGQDRSVDGVAQPDVPPEVAAALAMLPESDRLLAAQQRVCPVTGEVLGSMGKPVKLAVEGREVFICCDGCEEKLRSNSEQYFRILDGESV